MKFLKLAILLVVCFESQILARSIEAASNEVQDEAENKETVEMKLKDDDADDEDEEFLENLIRTSAQSEKSQCMAKYNLHETSDREDTKELKREVAKLRDLVKILKDQHYIMNILNAEPKSNTQEAKMEKHPLHSESEDLYGEITRLKDFIKKTQAQSVDSQIREQHLNFQLEKQQKDIEELKNMLHDLKIPIAEVTTTTDRPTLHEKPDAAIGGILKQLNELEFKLRKMHTMNTQNDTDFADDDVIVGSPLIKMNNSLIPPILPTPKDFVKIPMIPRSNARAADNDDFNTILDLLSAQSNKGEAKEDNDLETRLLLLERQLNKQKQKSRLLDQISKLEKQLKSDSSIESKSLDSDSSDLRKLLLRALKPKGKVESKSLDGDELVVSELKALEKVIRGLSTEDEGLDLDFDPEEKNVDIMVEKLIGNGGNKRKLSASDIAAIRKRLKGLNHQNHQESNSDLGGGYGVDAAFGPYGSHNGDSFGSSIGGLYGNPSFGNAYQTYGFPKPPYPGPTNYDPPIQPFQNYVPISNQYGTPTNFAYQSGSNYPQIPYAPTSLYTSSNYGPAYGLNKSPTNSYSTGATYNQPQSGTFQSFLENAYKNFFPANGAQAPAQTSYQQTAPIAPTSGTQLYANPPQGASSYGNQNEQKVSELKNQIYELQNVINTMNRPEYIQRPEDKEAVYNLDKQISDLKNVVNNLQDPSYNQPQQQPQLVYSDKKPEIYEAPPVEQVTPPQAQPQPAPVPDNAYQARNSHHVHGRNRHRIFKRSLDDNKETLNAISGLVSRGLGLDSLEESDVEPVVDGQSDVLETLNQRVAELRNQLGLNIPISEQRASNNYNYNNYQQQGYYYPENNYDKKTLKLFDKKDAFKEKKFEILDKILDKVMDKTEHALPRIFPRLLEIIFGSIKDVSFDSYGSNNGYSDGYDHSLENVFKGMGISGFIPLIIVKMLTNMLYVFKFLQKYKFFKTFLIPALVLLGVAGSLIFLVWWLQPNDDYYKVDHYQDSYDAPSYYPTSAYTGYRNSNPSQINYNGNNGNIGKYNQNSLNYYPGLNNFQNQRFQ